VVHPIAELPELRVAVGVLENVAGEVLIAERPATAVMAGAWEFPGGKLAPGETALQALARELREELRIEIQYVRFLAELSHTYGDEFDRRRVRLYCWKVLVWDGRVDAAEGQQLQWLQPDRLMQRGLLEADRPLVELLTGDNHLAQRAWQRVAEAAGYRV
jgi:8-oxo-dGTP diphosphatase